MTKPFSEWTVLPHGPIERLEDNLWTVTGCLQMPLGQFERRMSIVRLHDRRLVIYSAIALGEAEMTEIDNFGTPAFLIVPNDIHRLDARAWHDRYPAMQVIAPHAARPKVEEVVHVDATEVDLADPAVRFVVVPGTGEREAALVVKGASGTTLILNDLIFNLESRPGVAGWFFEKLGMTGDEPRMPAVIRMRQVVDPRALQRQFTDWSHLPNLKRILVSHGKAIANQPAQVLARIAGKLAA